MAAWAAPNVVLIPTDDQGFGVLAGHGDPHIRAPHLNRLHRERVGFTNAHVAPTCPPARAGLLAEQRPARSRPASPTDGRTPRHHHGEWEPFGGNCTDAWLREALEFIKRHRHDRSLGDSATNAPHLPHVVPERYVRP